jgi:hypothetical protein
MIPDNKMGYVQSEFFIPTFIMCEESLYVYG